MKVTFASAKDFRTKIHYKILNYRLLNDPVLNTSDFTSGTSISDGTMYSIICKLSVNDSNIYKNFRRYKSYFNVLEHVSKDFGKKYSSLLLAKDPTLKKYRNSKNQNNIGNPLKFYYKNFGFTSPTLLRYLKVLEDLEFLFGSIDNKTVAEIGIGYGGQAGTIIQNSKVAKYYLFDLTEVNILASKFLSQLDLINIYSFFDGRDPAPVKSDLLISNYAFSELTREVQEVYINKVILNAKAGYITWNDLGNKQLNSLSLDEILKKIPNSRSINEVPLTAKNNKIIIWGDIK
jgi:putative sugar O-methyltransferase